MEVSRRSFIKSGLVTACMLAAPARGVINAQTPLTPPANGVSANPLYALDGEKIVTVINGERKVVRLIGCDAPEAEAGENKSEMGFVESRQALNDAVAGRTLLLESDVEDVDNKDRLWRHVWLVNADGTDGGLLNQQLLQQGWVTTQEEKKNLKYWDTYTAAAKEAQTNKVGVLALAGGFHVETNRYGGHDAPAVAGETIDVDGIFMTLNSYYYSYTDALGSAAKGGYKYLIANVTITNLRADGKYNYSDGSFAAKDLNTAADYDDTFAFLNSPLSSGELSPTEYATGEVAIEVQENATNVRIKFTVSSGKALYWLTPA